MALTTSGSIEPQPNPRADADAAVNAFDATRMHREAGIASVASEHTSTPTAESSYADGSFELGKATSTAAKRAGAAINGAGTGFVGLANEGFAEPIKQVLP